MTLTHLTDFSDRLSPMLVKELRQGLRTKTFIAVFLILQGILAIMLLSAAASNGKDAAGAVVSGTIFIFFGIAVLIIQPLRGIAVLASEIKNNTIDMMVLTRLSASRIVLGKWIALVSQSALILVTIIPYLILRYFFGGMNLFAEVVLLLLLFLTSIALTAVTVGLSGSSSVIVRSLLPLIGTPVLFFSIIALSLSGGGNQLLALCSLESSKSIIAISLYIACILYIAGSALTLGASLIAPAAENHATARRLVALTLLILVGIIAHFTPLNASELLFLLLVIAAPALFLALTEPTHHLAIDHFPSLRQPLLRPLITFALTPGFPSGVVFTALISLITITISLLHPEFRNDTERTITLFSLLGSLLLPAVIQSFFHHGEGQRVATYFVFLTSSAILTIILASLSEAMSNPEILWLFVWNPLVILAMASNSKFDDSILIICLSAVNFTLLILLFIKASRLSIARRSATIPSQS